MKDAALINPRAFDPQAAIMPQDNSLANGEAETQTGKMLVRSVRGARERLKDLRQFFRRNADSVVADDQVRLHFVFQRLLNR